MFHLKKSVLFILTAFMVAALTSCNLGQAAEPTPTPVDLNAVMTSAAATAFSELTRIAAEVPPTETPTIAPADTQAPSNTEVGTIPATETPLVGVEATSPGLSAATAIPSFTPLASTGGSTGGSTGSSGGPSCKNSAFDGDITIPDGTTFKPWEKFTKAWKVRNTGTCRWDEGFSFRGWAGPPSMTAHPYYIGNRKEDWILAGDAVNIYINMYAPGDPGEYVAHWAMYDDAGKQFGGDFTVVIKVVK